MCYNCEICGSTSTPNQPESRITTYRTLEERRLKSVDKPWLGHKIITRTEIVKEMSVCPRCKEGHEKGMPHHVLARMNRPPARPPLAVRRVAHIPPELLADRQPLGLAGLLPTISGKTVKLEAEPSAKEKKILRDVYDGPSLEEGGRRTRAAKKKPGKDKKKSAKSK